MASGTIKSVVPRSDIINNLTTNDSTKVLSAAQGYALNNKTIQNTESFSSLSTFKTFLANMTVGKAVDIITSSEVSTAIAGSTYICSGIATKIDSSFVDISWVRGDSAVGSTRYKISSQTFTINDLNGKFANNDLGTFSTLASFDSALLTFASGIPEGELRNVKVVFSAAADPFSNTTYYGTVKRNQNNQYWAVFETVISNSFITGRYRTSTNQWYWADQISSLISKLAVTSWSNQTVANIKSGLITLGSSMEDGEMRQIKFVASAAVGVIRASDTYAGYIRRYGANYYYIDASDAGFNENLILEYKNGTWVENVIPADINSKINALHVYYAPSTGVTADTAIDITSEVNLPSWATIRGIAVQCIYGGSAADYKATVVYNPTTSKFMLYPTITQTPIRAYFTVFYT